jgi:hypothetical protein
MLFKLNWDWRFESPAITRRNGNLELVRMKVETVSGNTIDPVAQDWRVDVFHVDTQLVRTTSERL